MFYFIRVLCVYLNELFTVVNSLCSLKKCTVTIVTLLFISASCNLLHPPQLSADFSVFVSCVVFDCR